jgi:hypothetical protein
MFNQNSSLKWEKFKLDWDVINYKYKYNTITNSLIFHKITLRLKKWIKTYHVIVCKIVINV